MTTFTIVIYTYNRLNLLKDTIMSVLNQTYPHFELIIVNNGSTDGTQHYVEGIVDPRVKILRMEKNDGVIHDIPLEEYRGDYILPFLGDDDFLTSKTLETVAEVVSVHPDVDSLFLGCVSFNLDSHILNMNELSDFNGELRALRGKNEFVRFVNSWGIGRKSFQKSFGRVHSSASFFSRELLAKTKGEQREIFIKPFGDVGLIGALLYAQRACYLSVPLIIIGVHERREMTMSRPSNRRLCDRLSAALVYSPVKAATFFSLGAESHLKVIYYNKLEGLYDWSLRPKFYIIHMAYLLCDKCWDKRTIRDLTEVVPLMMKSFFHYTTCSLFCSPLSLVKILCSAARMSFLWKKIKKFSNALELADWLAKYSWNKVPLRRVAQRYTDVF